MSPLPGNKTEDENHLLLDYQKYASMRDICLSKNETKIDDIRKLSHENLISTTIDEFRMITMLTD